MQQSLPMINNQLSRIEHELGSLNTEKHQHQIALAASQGQGATTVLAEQQMLSAANSRMDALEREKQKLEQEKAQIEQELSDLNSKITQNEAEHKAMTDRKLALTG